MINTSDATATVTRIEFLLGIFLVVPLAGDSDTDSPWNAPDTTAPDVLVELHINSDISGSHSLLCKLPDLLDGIWCFLLEGAAIRSSTD